MRKIKGSNLHDLSVLVFKTRAIPLCSNLPYFKEGLVGLGPTLRVWKTPVLTTNTITPYFIVKVVGFEPTVSRFQAARDGPSSLYPGGGGYKIRTCDSLGRRFSEPLHCLYANPPYTKNPLHFC